MNLQNIFCRNPYVKSMSGTCRHHSKHLLECFLLPLFNVDLRNKNLILSRCLTLQNLLFNPFLSDIFFSNPKIDTNTFPISYMFRINLDFHRLSQLFPFSCNLSLSSSSSGRGSVVSSVPSSWTLSRCGRVAAAASATTTGSSVCPSPSSSSLGGFPRGSSALSSVPVVDWTPENN